MDLEKLGEFGLIDRIQSRFKLQSPDIIQGIGDDCAVFKGRRGNYQLLSTDALVEKVHFDLKTHTPEQLGYKALAVNASDIAAMGGIPKLAVIALGIPKTLPLKFVDALYKGLDRACRTFAVDLVGGDTVASLRHLFISITILGETVKRRLFTRKGARPGDAIFVTGTLGNSALGLKILKSRKKWLGGAALQKKLVQKHRVPVPRLKEAEGLARSSLRVTSMIDISDGLTQDLGHILSASGVGAQLRESCLPVSKHFSSFCNINELKQRPLILGGGEEYELLFTLKPEDDKKLTESFDKYGTSVTRIGEILAQPVFRVVRESGRTETLQTPMGFNHFKGSG